VDLPRGLAFLVLSWEKLRLFGQYFRGPMLASMIDLAVRIRPVVIWDEFRLCDRYTHDMSDTTETRLGRDVYLALAAVGWADGELDPEEADAIVRTAAEEGLPIEQIAEIEEATKKPLDMGVIDRSGLTKEDRLFVYCVASWMTRLDGLITDAEVDALKQLGDKLKIPELARTQADMIVQQVAQLPQGDRPDRYDLARIRQILGRRLALAQAIGNRGDRDSGA